MVSAGVEGAVIVPGPDDTGEAAVALAEMGGIPGISPISTVQIEVTYPSFGLLLDSRAIDDKKAEASERAADA